MSGYWGYIENGKLITPGVDFSRPLEVIRDNGTYVVVKWPGRKVWSGVGRPWAWFPSRLMLLKVWEKDKSRPDVQLYKVIEEIEYGRRYKQALLKLTAMMEAK